MNITQGYLMDLALEVVQTFKGDISPGLTVTPNGDEIYLKDNGTVVVRCNEYPETPVRIVSLSSVRK